jgi:hypothetical protein
MMEYELRAPRSDEEWRALHAIRRKVLFENRGKGDTYIENHPDDFKPGHHPLIFLYRGVMGRGRGSGGWRSTKIYSGWATVESCFDSQKALPWPKVVMRFDPTLLLRRWDSMSVVVTRAAFQSPRLRTV